METRRRVEARFEADRWEGPEWTVMGATLRERLSEPYFVRVDVAITGTDLDASSLLGSSCLLSLVRRNTTLRVAGIVTMVREGTDPNHRTHAHLSVEPALSALRYRADSRIFQALSVPEILEQVLGEDLAPFGRRVESRLEGSYPKREYTVQYRETDFDFAHRLMEDEGIGYCFEHDGDEEVLVLFDRPAHHLAIEGENGSTLPYVARMDGESDAAEGVVRFESVSRVRPNRVVARHFDWTHPSVAIEATSEAPDSAWPALETYVHDAPLTFHGFDHTYGAHNMADQLRLHAERARRDAWLADGTGSSLAMRAGRQFDLVEHPRVDLDGAWTVIEAEHRYLSHVAPSDAHDGLGYVNRFTCLPSTIPWRPDRVRPAPRIHGVQTATVVGPSGEEIHCDPHGRVKLHFHWDRLGSRDDHDSCWIRVMQTMGGPAWGFSFIPRIGMEVVVTFIEGDPNQPLVTGVVYNAENPPPYDFPADKTRTTIKTSSSPGGEGFNELRFEDKAGSEEIWIHGEKDWNTLIKNDLTRRVGHNETQEVEVDRVRKVGHDEAITIGHDQTKLVEHDESDTVGHDRVRQVGNNESVSIGVDQVIKVGHDETVTIGNDENVTIGNNSSQKIGASLLQSIGQNLTQQVLMNAVQNVGMNAIRNVVADDTVKVGGEGKMDFGKSLLEKVGADLTQKIKQNLIAMVGMNRTTTVTMMDTLTVILGRTENITLDSTENVGQSKKISAKEAIVLESGDSSITLAKDGTITIKGKKVVVAGDDVVDVDGGLITLN